jgi:hypothetical protein
MVSVESGGIEFRTGRPAGTATTARVNLHDARSGALFPESQ